MEVNYQNIGSGHRIIPSPDGCHHFPIKITKYNQGKITSVKWVSPGIRHQDIFSKSNGKKTKPVFHK